MFFFVLDAVEGCNQGYFLVFSCVIDVIRLTCCMCMLMDPAQLSSVGDLPSSKKI
jgi:hypothetical protein